MKIFLIGNKTDLEASREVPKDMGRNLQYARSFDYFSETSAKDGFNIKNVRKLLVTKVFIDAAKVLLQDHLLYKDARLNESDTV